MSEIEKYVSVLKRKESDLLAEIARLERSLSRVRQKLLAPEKSIKKDSNNVSLRRELGEDIPKKKFPAKKNDHAFSPGNIEDTKKVAEEASKKSRGFFAPLVGAE